MNRAEFLAELRKSLSGLPQSDIEERLAFYSEMIEDRMEEGLSEEEAVSATGEVSDIASQVIAEIPLSKIAKERIQPKRRLTAWEISLIALGSPIWLSLGIAAAAVIISVYAAIWAVICALWATFAAMVCSLFGGFVTGIVFICTGITPTAVAIFSAVLVLAGLSVFMFFGCRTATKGLLLLTKKLALWTKGCFIKKEVAR